jgi:hypothetical protein
MIVVAPHASRIANAGLISQDFFSSLLDSSMYMEIDEVRRLMRVITSKRDRSAFLIADNRGLRAHEVGLLMLSHSIGIVCSSGEERARSPRSTR